MNRTTLVRYVLVLVLSAALCSAVLAQGTTSYVYDDNGRLRAVISSNGEAAVYDYDPAGNFTAIRRLTANDLELFSFTPHQGLPGDLVSFTGVGFGAGVSSVLFNGVPAQIVSVTPSTVVAEVPQGVTTGPIVLTTPHGALTTPIPFTIKGVRLTPSSIRVFSGESVQFTATVVVEGDQNLRWTVNDIEGGNIAIGTISATGLYLASRPSLNEPSPTFFVRATSIASPGLFGEARVTVLNQESVHIALASPVLVRRGPTLDQPSTRSSISLGVLIRRGFPPESSTQPIISAGVLATTGPHISAISPNHLTRGAIATLNISGLNLSGASSVSFVNTNGTIDSNIVASGLTVNADGTAATATVSVSSSAQLGRRVVLISTLIGHSLAADISQNTIQITDQ